MKIFLACPAPARSTQGNRATALRWAAMLRGLGHTVTVSKLYDGRRYDLLVALHARKSAAAVRKFHAAFPELPLVVALTGTDLYRDLGRSRSARRAIALANRLIVLQPLALRALPFPLRPKARVIYQSAMKPKDRPCRSRETFDVVVVGHLRGEKDPMRSALAARLLPKSSRARVLHIGKAMTSSWQKRALTEMVRNPRYRWLGERLLSETQATIASSRLMVLSSRMEGGANVVSEAIVASVPVVASRIPGSVGLLGAKYPALFAPGDSRALARLLWRAESDVRFYRRLVRACVRRARLFDPAREIAAWSDLLNELSLVAGRNDPRPDRGLLESRTSTHRHRGRGDAPSPPRR